LWVEFDESMQKVMPFWQNSSSKNLVAAIYEIQIVMNVA